MGTSSQFLAFFKMAPTLTCRYYAPINVKSQDWGGGGGGVGQGVRILTFSEKEHFFGNLWSFEHFFGNLFQSEKIYPFLVTKIFFLCISSLTKRINIHVNSIVRLY